ncbi:unnamed protein product [Sphacelaria rigidula]
MLDLLSAYSEGVDLYVAAHKCTFFVSELVWCGKLYPHGRVYHDPVRLQGLFDMRRPETAADGSRTIATPSGRELAAYLVAAYGRNHSSLTFSLRRTHGGCYEADEAYGKKPRHSTFVWDGGQATGVGGSEGSSGSCRDAVQSSSWLSGVDVSGCIWVPLG